MQTSLIQIIAQLAKLAEIHPESVSNISSQIAKIAVSYPTSVGPLADALSDGQLISKQWLADNLKGIDLGTIFLCGGWFATLLFDQRLSYAQCISFDIDHSCKKPAEIIHRKLLMDGWKFLAFTMDIRDINYSMQPLTVIRSNGTTVDITVTPNTIINTSCEHIENFKAWWDLIPTGKLVALQTNNGFDIHGHVNCVASLIDFADQTPLTSVLYEGEKEMPKFTRFMRIGVK